MIAFGLTLNTRVYYIFQMVRIKIILRWIIICRSCDNYEICVPICSRTIQSGRKVQGFLRQIPFYITHPEWATSYG